MIRVIVPLAVFTRMLTIKVLGLVFSASPSISILENVHQLHVIVVIVVTGSTIRKYVIIFGLPMIFSVLFLHPSHFI